MQWEACFGAESYTVKHGEQDGGPYAAIGTGIEANLYKDTSAVEGTSYYYVVSANNEQGEGRDSVQIEIAQ